MNPFSATQTARATFERIAAGDIWQLVGKTYETYLEKYPKSTTFRTEYFQWAVNAKKWDVAREQLKLLGDLWDRFAIGEMELVSSKRRSPNNGDS